MTDEPKSDASSDQFPPGYSRPTRKTPPSFPRRLSITRLMQATACCALAFAVVPLVFGPDALILYTLIGLLVALVAAKHGGADAAVKGFIVGLFLVPVVLVAVALFVAIVAAIHQVADSVMGWF